VARDRAVIHAIGLTSHTSQTANSNAPPRRLVEDHDPRVGSSQPLSSGSNWLSDPHANGRFIYGGVQAERSQAPSAYPTNLQLLGGHAESSRESGSRVWTCIQMVDSGIKCRPTKCRPTIGAASRRCKAVVRLVRSQASDDGRSPMHINGPANRRAAEKDDQGVTRRHALKVGAAAVGGTWLATAGVGGTATATAAAATPRRGGTALVSFSSAQTSDKLDPAQLETFFEAYAGGLLYDSLLEVDANNTPVPALATSWTSSKDLRTWTFELRQGVEFHDGRPFTSADVVWTIARLLNPASGSGATPEFAPFLKPSGMRPRGPHVIEFNLEQPNAFLPNLLSTFYPRIIPNGTTTAETAKGVGTGPFKLVSFSPGVELQVVRNPRYWQSNLPYLDGVKVSVITEQATKLESVVSGNADAGDAIPFSSYTQVSSSSNCQLVSAPGASFYTMTAFQGNAPNNDVRVVQALKYALDREAILQTAFYGHGTVSADVCVPPNDPWYPTGLTPYPYDPEKAKALLKAAGHPNGITAPFLVSELSPGMTDMATVIQQTAAAGGFNFSLHQLPVGTYYAQVPQKPYWVDSWIRQAAPLLVPEMYSPIPKGTPATELSPNESDFSNSQVTQLLAQARTTLDITKQRQAFRDVFELVRDTCGELVPVQLESAWVVKKQLQGVVLNPANVATFTGAYFA